jgi:hypothetical protein
VFLGHKAVPYCIANLVVSMPSLEAYLVACIIGVKKEGLDPKSLIASKFWVFLLRNRYLVYHRHTEIRCLQ